MQVRPIHIYVVGVAAVTAAVMAYMWPLRGPYPGHAELFTFVFIALLLDQAFTALRVSATGSTSFIIHLAAGILFGGFWGGVIAASSNGCGALLQRKSFPKLVFNLCQRALSVAVAAVVYRAILHGGFPPAYLRVGSVAPAAVQRDLLLFFAFAATYTIVNAAAVSVAVSLSTDRPLREIWHLNTRGLLGYDLGASVIAILIAILFSKTEAAGYGPIGMIGVVVPIVVVRHIYGMYYQLQGNGQELLQVMVKAIEARDPYTSGHSLRVSALSRAIAVEAGLPARQIEQVETAALLHDVGKIYEEFAPLLRKQERLTPEETALMQTHAARSADLVGIISKFRGAIQDAVRHHHERWDGQGYPDGLHGEEIPLGARIILIADTVDAMTTDRPYRKRLGLEVVIAELQRCKGTQFDPDLVDRVVTSVAVRRLISEPTTAIPVAPQSRRVVWPKTSRWLARRA
jgi:HD-GYP domain-containing protein (c-di-GMP phosphodiesterase class II)